MRVGIFHTAFLGDLALCGRLIENLWRNGHEIFLISNSSGCNLYTNDFRISKTEVVKKERGLRKVSSVFKIASQISFLDLEWLLVPHKSFTSGLISKLSGVKNIVGFSNSVAPFFFTKIIPFDEEKHESERCSQLAFPEKFGPSIDEKRNFLKVRKEFEPVLFVQNEFRFLKQKFPRYFLVSPGTVWATKAYPPNSLAKAVEKMLSSNDALFCVVNAGPDDKMYVQQFLDGLAENKNRVIVGNIPLRDMIAVYEKALFAISNDSAPFHVACATNTISIGLFGPTSFTTGFGGIGKNALVLAREFEHGDRLACQPCSKHGHKVCPAIHHRCMTELSADWVSRKVMNFVSLNKEYECDS